MTRFGLIDLPVLDERTGLLVAGHGRIDSLRARQDSQAAPPEGIDTDTDGEWLVPVIRGWASRNDDEAQAAAIAVNALEERGGWDTDRLIPLLDRLAEGPGLDGIGYGPGDLRDLLKDRDEQWDPEGGSSATARREASIDELADNYRNKQVRTLVLDYPLEEFRQVVELAGPARTRHGTPGNAELLVALLRRWETGHPEP